MRIELKIEACCRCDGGASTTRSLIPVLLRSGVDSSTSTALAAADRGRFISCGSETGALPWPEEQLEAARQSELILLLSAIPLGEGRAPSSVLAPQQPRLPAIHFFGIETQPRSCRQMMEQGCEVLSP